MSQKVNKQKIRSQCTLYNHHPFLFLSSELRQSAPFNKLIFFAFFLWKWWLLWKMERAFPKASIFHRELLRGIGLLPKKLSKKSGKKIEPKTLQISEALSKAGAISILCCDCCKMHFSQQLEREEKNVRKSHNTVQIRRKTEMKS